MPYVVCRCVAMTSLALARRESVNEVRIKGRARSAFEWTQDEVSHAHRLFHKQK